MGVLTMKKHLLRLWRKVTLAWYHQVVTPCEVHFLFPLMGLRDWLEQRTPEHLRRKKPVLAGCEQLETRWLMSSGVTECSLPNGGTPWRLTVGPDNLIWLTEKTNAKIAKMTTCTPTSSSFTEYSTGAGTTPWDIT